MNLNTIEKVLIYVKHYENSVEGCLFEVRQEDGMPPSIRVRPHNGDYGLVRLAFVSVLIQPHSYGNKRPIVHDGQPLLPVDGRNIHDHTPKAEIGNIRISPSAPSGRVRVSGTAMYPSGGVTVIRSSPPRASHLNLMPTSKPPRSTE